MGRPKKVVDEPANEEKQELLEEIMANKPPAYGSKEWSDYVLTQFSEDEVEDGNPNVHGLRRVAENLLGPFIGSGPVELKSSLDGDTLGRAYCIYEITVYPFMVGSEQPTVGSGYERRIYRAAADAFMGNTDDEFAKYPTAMAEVRAEARCLRKMLKLNKVSSEEITSKSTKDFVDQEQTKKIEATFAEDDSISTSQIFIIKDRCKMLNIDVMKLINSGEKTYEFIEQVSKGTAAKIIQRISQYQNSSVEIPSDLLLA